MIAPKSLRNAPDFGQWNLQDDTRRSTCVLKGQANIVQKQFRKETAQRKENSKSYSWVKVCVKHNEWNIKAVFLNANNWFYNPDCLQ